MSALFNALLLRSYCCAQCEGALLEIHDYNGLHVVCGRNHDHKGFIRQTTVLRRQQRERLEGLELRRVFPELSGFVEPTPEEIKQDLSDLFGGEKIMPIKGLTDQGADFPKIGDGRKGETKTEKRPGKDLDYFRVEFNEGEEQAAKTFREVYGDKPRKVNIRLMFNEIDRFWEAWQEAYVSGALVHRCDGEFVQYAIDPSNGALLAREGLSAETGEPVRCLGYAVKKDGQPYTTKKGKRIECKPTGRLRVIIPELRRFACLMFHTTSIWDVINISSNLAGIKWASGDRLQGLPCILRRVLDNKSTPGPGGKRIRRDMWLIKIEADEDWVGAKIKQLEIASFPALPAPAEAATEIIEGGVVDVTTGEILDEEEGIDIPLNGNGDAEEEVPARWFEDAEVFSLAEKWLFSKGKTWTWALGVLGVKKIADYPGTRAAAKEAWEVALRDARPKKAKRKKQGALI